MAHKKILVSAIIWLIFLTGCAMNNKTNTTDESLQYSQTWSNAEWSDTLTNNEETNMAKYEAPAIEENDIIASIKTNTWTIKLKLFNDLVPKTSTNFIGLAKEWYYNDVIFHRVISWFMIQWGDPDGTWAGGQSLYGESFEDEFNDTLKNNRGTISMANSWVNTNGSQFFINLVNNNFLDNKHSVFGQVVEWMDVVDAIAKTKTGENDRPEKEIKMIWVEITQYKNGKYEEYAFNKEEAIAEAETARAEAIKKETAEAEEKKVANKDRIAIDTDTLMVHYTWKLDDGEVFDSSYDRGAPLEVNIPEKQVIPGFGNGLIGMKIGEKKTITLTPAEAYGEYDEANTQDFPITDLTSQWITPVEWGTVPSIMWELKVVKVTEETVTLNVNHPLAGKTLTFELELIDFVD